MENKMTELEKLINQAQKMQSKTGKKIARSFKTPTNGLPPETFGLATQLKKKRNKRGKK